MRATLADVKRILERLEEVHTALFSHNTIDNFATGFQKGMLELSLTAIEPVQYDLEAEITRDGDDYR